MNPRSRRTFLRSAAAVTALSCGARWTLAAPATAPQLSDAEILAQCPDRIQKHRVGAGTLTVRTAQGKPVAGARVRLQQIRHEFLFGSNLFGFGRHADPGIQDQYNQRFSALLNYATLPFYWPMYEPQRGQPEHARTEQTVEWCRSQGILCKGHPLVWDFADPRWLPSDPEEIRRLSHERVTDCIRRFAGRIDRWDVVNEPTHLGRFGTRLGEWAQSVGAVPYVREHLVTARAAGPQATLLVNDYRVDPPFYAILDQLRDGGKLMFDTVGIQSHMHRNVWPLAKVWEVCDTYARLGLPVHFTETTVVSGPFLGLRESARPRPLANNENWGDTTPELETRQAEQVERFYTALFAHPAVQAITWWDFSDANAWKGAPAGWLRKDMSPKPAYEALRALIKGRWWSTWEGQTDPQGRLPARLHFGDYQATITLPNGTESKLQLQWPRQSERSPVVTL